MSKPLYILNGPNLNLLGKRQPHIYGHDTLKDVENDCREIAAQLRAEKLIMLSDVDGLYLRAGEPDTKLSRLTADEAEAMINAGTATGGMIPKLQSIVQLLRRGVHSAHILSGTTRNALLSEVFTDSGTGTMIVA